MDYTIKRNAKAPHRAAASTLPLGNLQIAKEINGELVGDALLLKNVELKDVSTKVYAQAKRLNVKVSLKSSKEGVLVFRVQQNYIVAGQSVTRGEVTRRAKEAGTQETIVLDRLHAGVDTWAELLRKPTEKELIASRKRRVTE